MKAEKTVRKISREYKQYARNVAEMKNRYDLQLAEERGLKEGREEGRQEGREEGRQEGRAEGLEQGMEKRTLEIARKMKAAGKPLSEIAEFTGLPAETIERM